MRQKLLIGCAIFAGSFLLFALVGVIAGIPIPRVHDEFSYLLAADTFSHGRLTNSTHPLWEYFETFYVIHRPTYQTKYPPAQGLALALGQVIWHPALGVWLSSAAAIAAVFWCLTRWVPLPWAAVGAALTALHPMVLRWTQSYWGGSIALLGGALVVGAMRGAGKYDIVIAAVGALILANSRPYEGLVLVILAALFLLRRLTLRSALAATAVVVVGFGWIAYYNHRVSGRALQLPYLLHEKQYAVFPVFFFQQMRPVPGYRHERLRQFHAEMEVAEFLKQKEQGFVRSAGTKLMRLVRGTFRLFLPSMDGEKFQQPFPPIYLSAGFLIPIAGAAAAARTDRWLLVALLLALACALASTMVVPLFPHYSAPAAPLVIVFLTAGLMYAARWRVVLPVFLMVWIASAVVSVWIIRLGQTGAGVWVDAPRRASLQAKLEATGTKHLVIVRYPPRSFLHFEWVWNRANIDAAPVVWARDMGDNRRLVEYFQGRQLWLLDTEKRETINDKR